MNTQLRDTSGMTGMKSKNSSTMRDQLEKPMMLQNLQGLALKHHPSHMSPRQQGSDVELPNFGGDNYPTLRLVDSQQEDEEFDPNELKLLPVLATDRHQRRAKENELKQLRKQQK